MAIRKILEGPLPRGYKKAKKGAMRGKAVGKDCREKN